MGVVSHYVLVFRVADYSTVVVAAYQVVVVVDVVIVVDDIVAGAAVETVSGYVGSWVLASLLAV